ncbi:MAG TPA: DUF2267 domain-containing protein [Candidatus Limnocylindrales bacterium]|nr:DUF2267 domain-containing protein [Candidatus Limnocylindrales bacterium]
METKTTGAGPGVHVFDQSLQTANTWIHEIMTELHSENAQEALQALRAVLHLLRDRLPAAEAVHLGGQLPLLVAGLYFNGFQLRDKPIKYDRNEFLQQIAQNLSANNVRNPDPMRYMYAVVRVITRRISQGQSQQIEGSLPEDLRQLWRMFEQGQMPAAAA